MGEDGPAYLAHRPEDQDFGFRCHRFHLTNSWLAVEWVVGIAVGVAAVERLPIVGVERKPEFNPLGQVRIGDKMTTESDQIGVALLNNGLGGVGLGNHLRR